LSCNRVTGEAKTLHKTGGIFLLLTSSELILLVMA
jgi:hypothetical protein